MQTSENIAELAAALAKAQGQIEGARKDSENPAFKNGGKATKYADLASVWDACREALSVNGLSIVQAPGPCAQNQLEMTTMLLHSSWQWIRETLTIPLQKVDAQGYGSATTYARRYSLAAMVGVAPDDDDGNAASNPQGANNDAHHNGTPAPREKLAGPHTSKTALWAAVKNFDREIRSCGDIDQFEALMADKGTKALIEQVMRDAAAVWSTGEGMPPEFEPLERLIQLTRDELNIRAAA